MGRLIPAGTGLPMYKKLGIKCNGRRMRSFRRMSNRSFPRLKK